MDLSVAEVKLGRERLYSGIIRDITERKEREQEMVLMRSNAELSQFAYIASHDLKAPLRGIQKLALWIAEDIGEALTPQAKEQFDLLHKRVARLEAMLEDILRYSRVGRITEDPETLNIGELLAQVAGPVAMDGKFSVRYEGSMPVMTVHRTPLEQVFSNLIVNAVKHHDRGTGTLTLGVVPRGRYYEFYVQDDGPGIPPQFHEKVFQIFQTLQPRDRKEGVGLGMAIVRKLVEWQGGKVWIESPVAGGRGTAFRFLWRDQGREPDRDQASAARTNRHLN
jgi:signal transduction histidine kinase